MLCPEAAKREQKQLKKKLRICAYIHQTSYIGGAQKRGAGGRLFHAERKEEGKDRKKPLLENKTATFKFLFFIPIFLIKKGKNSEVVSKMHKATKE